MEVDSSDKSRWKNGQGQQWLHCPAVEETGHKFSRVNSLGNIQPTDVYRLLGDVKEWAIP